MTKHHFFSIAALAGLLFIALPARADDIDIYSGLSGNANIPNVMMVVDNPSSQNNDAVSCLYSATMPFVGGQAPTNPSQALGLDQCALANIIWGMSTKSDGSALVKIGMTSMTGADLALVPVDDQPYNGGAATTVTITGIPVAFAANGVATISYPNPIGTKTYNCNTTSSPCTDRQALILSLMAVNQTTGKSGQGAELQETWAYYVGGTGILSGRTYPGTNATTGCQKNYIIYLSNLKANASHAQEWNQPSELGPLDTAARGALSSGALTAAQFNVVDPSASSYSGAIPNKPQNGWGIEWARFMNTVDTNSSNGAVGTQNIVTYSVATGNVGQGLSMETYIQDVGVYGGGKYFAAGNSYDALYQDLLKILNEVQAVNSVFASASLPVSVNAQGTYLNQIYMGMFRPDASGMPRWLGNLKQYQFVYTPPTSTTPATLTLADSQTPPASAISSAGTGFLSPNAVSFWTKKDTSKAPDGTSGTYTGGGFWRNKPQGIGGGYDSPDGEVVEKGGAGQQIRTANLKNNYTAAAGSTNNPRNVVTYCPSGTSCVASLFDSSNLFTASNIPASGFNPSYVSVTSIVRTGTTALVTTAGPHGMSNGTTVTITGASPTDYNGAFVISGASGDTFTISGLGDYPHPTSQNAYTASINNANTPQSISAIAVATSNTANANGCTSGTIPNINCSLVTITTSVAHGFATGNVISISGISPAAYNGTHTITVLNSVQFTYTVTITPPAPSVNTYSVQRPSDSAITVTSIANSGKLSAANTFSAGDTVTTKGVPGVTDGANTIASTSLSASSFKLGSGSPSSCAAPTNCGTVTRTYPLITLNAGSLTRATATSTTATVSGYTYPSTPVKALLTNAVANLKYVSGSGTNGGAYVPLSGTYSPTITCTGASGACTSFTFPLNPAVGLVPSTASPTMSSATATLVSNPVTIPVGAITRASGSSTATVTGVANTFITGQTINIGATGTVVGNEDAYAGAWTITCPASCSTSFTYGPVTLTPATPATGTMAAYSGTAPDTTTLVNWVRGMDNAGDEPSPDPTFGTINVRGSVHGDVLHSRPAVINYGGTNNNTVVYYGANDGVFHAVNGNQTVAIGSTPAGGELWGFVPSELLSGMTRLRDNSPLLLLPSTPPGILPTPTTKTYFADGSIGVYQKLNANGTTNDAYIYLSMRRGGSFIYALHVQDPTAPSFVWKISQGGVTTNSGFTSSSDYAELGQTWSQPKVALLHGYVDSSGNPKPLLIFGAGYDPAEDSEPPGTDDTGRGIYIVDAISGSLVWSVTAGSSDACVTDPSGKPTRCTKANMKWSIPSDVTLIDANSDGYVDRLYVGDTGGNIWRVDLEPNGYTNTASVNPSSSWAVTQLAALGCSTGMCTSGTPRKFFYPPDMVPSSNGAYQGVLIGSGDREHPLYANASYSVTNRFYMIKDTNTGAASTDLYTANIESNLKNITPASGVSATSYDGTRNGYYLSMGTGEKVVNGATTVAGYTYFATNTPATPTSNSCTTNLGVAKGYAITPLTGSATAFTYSGGGLPPTTVAGVVDVSYTDANGHAQTAQVPFCLGCGGNPNLTPTGGSAIAGSKPPITVPTNRTKRYWYIEKR